MPRSLDAFWSYEHPRPRRRVLYSRRNVPEERALADGCRMRVAEKLPGKDEGA